MEEALNWLLNNNPEFFGECDEEGLTVQEKDGSFFTSIYHKGYGYEVIIGCSFGKEKIRAHSIVECDIMDYLIVGYEDDVEKINQKILQLMN